MRQRKYKDVKLLSGITPRAAQDKMDKITWKKDTWREAWDSVGAPQWVQHCLNEIEEGKTQPEGALDCDDFACWAAKVIDAEYEPYFFGQGWAPIVDGVVGFKTTGHAICVVKSPVEGELWHCGNWGLIGPFSTLRDVSVQLFGNQGVPIAWCLYTADMKLIKKGNNIPPQTIPSLM